MGSLYLDHFFGSADIGLFTTVTSRYAIVPLELGAKKRAALSRELGVEVVPSPICGTSIVGVFLAANSNGMVLPHLALQEEVERISSGVESVNTLLLRSRVTAMGNLILANDRGAIVSPEFTRREASQISETLDVSVVRSRIAGRSYVGSIGVATNLGALIHVDSDAEDLKMLSDVLKVPADVGTVNGGVAFVPSGLVANQTGAAIGARTTGPEMVAISRAIRIL